MIFECRRLELFFFSLFLSTLLFLFVGIFFHFYTSHTAQWCTCFGVHIDSKTTCNSLACIISVANALRTTLNHHHHRRIALQHHHDRSPLSSFTCTTKTDTAFFFPSASILRIKLYEVIQTKPNEEMHGDSDNGPHFSTEHSCCRTTLLSSMLNLTSNFMKHRRIVRSISSKRIPENFLEKRNDNNKQQQIYSHWAALCSYWNVARASSHAVCMPQ